MSGAAAPVPLMSLDAVVVDTETTGLDPRRDRIVQVGAVAFERGRLGQEEMSALVNPGIPIPSAASAIHGIGDADVDAAAPFAEAMRKFEAFIAERVVIGHNIGFDLAVLQEECRRADLIWKERRALDVRFLAQVVEPNLPDYSIEALARWLDVAIEGRHSALGDARSTARIFCALIPHLRKRHIRTLAEAETACANLSQLLETYRRAGWASPQRREEAQVSQQALARLDSYPYRHRIREVMSAPPIVVPPDTPMKDAVQLMTERRISSVFVSAENRVRAHECGIVTERDFMRALATSGNGVLEEAVAHHMHSPLEAVPRDAFLYLAIGRMARLNIRHLGVIDEEGVLVGALSQRDLLRLRGSDAIELGDEILVAESEAELAAAWSRRAAMARSLLAERVTGREISAVLSRSLSSLTRRVTELAEARLGAAGRGGPPASYAMLVLGSGGRGESMLAPDQDNAIVYADLPEAEVEAADAWFSELGSQVADMLDVIGIPYCRGGVMASNAEWRGSLSEWKKRVVGWMRRQHPDDLLNVDIFFDLQAVKGDAALARELWQYAYDTGSQGTAFAKLLAELGTYDPPFGLFGGIHTENGRLDLKMNGIFPIVAAARVLSIRHHVLERSTAARLQGVRALGIGSDDDLERLLHIHGLLVALNLEQQLRDIEVGIAPSNKVLLSQLTRRQMAELKAALKELGMVNELVRDLMFPG